ncbi:MAG: NAD(P)/FAD-dependent oxidoreductase [Candidatus Binataceae bacterium]|jgi:2-polyprenyl-6-methoxyphenol hydroxylase-like FAD-dependent oxidoreductase
MPQHEYDIITVGGGLAGATLAKAMAENGARVLVIERERQFKDRVRGEGTFPWGVAELEKLGVYELLLNTCARSIRWEDTYMGGVRTEHRDLIATSRQRLPMLNWLHHEMEEVLLKAAQDAGAEVRRGARASGLTPGAKPAVFLEEQGRVDEIRARLVVCADGRGSVARKWLNLPVEQESYGMLLAGVLCEATPDVPDDTNHFFLLPGPSVFAFLCPQGQGRTRAYAWHPRERDDRFQGAEDLPRFVQESVKAGVPAEWYSRLEPIGPLATFDGTNNWVDHPYRDGIALIGDAAASTDPSYGQGQSLAAMDARVLRDQLLAHSDWDVAGHAYASEHDRYYAAVHEYTDMLYEMFYAVGPVADARRARAFPLIAQEPERVPDGFVSGPEIPLGETVKRRFFGEE